MAERVRGTAVTGLGLVTSLGIGTDVNWRALSAGASGAAQIDAFETEGLPTQFAARVAHPTFEADFPQQRVIAMARAALREAMADANLDRSGMLSARSRLFLATPHGEVFVHDRLRLLSGGTSSTCSPDELWRSGLVGPLGLVLKEEFGIGGAPVTVSTACASSASAIQLAVEAIGRGDIDVAVVVASDASVHPEGLLRFSLLSALSTRNEEPAKASRPFSQSRDGFVMGEGAAALVLERDPAPSKRIWGKVLGCGDATDNFHRTRSHPSGRTIVKCMEAALASAGLSIQDVDYINAHGTSTPENDKMEALGIRELFGDLRTRVPTSSNKSMVGHTLSAAGAVEATFTLLALEHGFLPPTINHDDPDPDIDLDVIPNVGRASDAKIALSNSFGFGGQNVSLVLQKAGE